MRSGSSKRKARLHKDKEKKDDVQGTFTKDDTVTLPRLKSALSPQKQEQRTESSFITPLHPGKGRHLFAPSPLLFSPEDNEVVVSNRKKQHSTVKQDEWTTPRGYLRTHRNFGLSPATPACSAITPNQVTAVSQMSAVGSISQPSPNFSPFPTWNPNLQDDTPMFMKRLFKTPKTLTRTGSVRSHTMPASTMKTPQRLSVSLGADMDISNISWSSSLATPPATSSEKKKLDFSTDEKSEISFEDGECKKGQITARALFTTDQPDGRCDPDNISRVEVGNVAPVRGIFNLEGYIQSEESPPLARMPDTESSDIAYEVILDADRMHEAKKVSKELRTEPNKQHRVLDKTTEHCQKKIASGGQNINIEMSSDPDNLNNNNNMMCDKSVINNTRSETSSKNPQFDSDMTIRSPQSEKSKPSSPTLDLPECIDNKTLSIGACQENMAASKYPQHAEQVDSSLGQQKSLN
ncbi:uncharacterized protein [Ptychodera flava]|uniref:uncharacterized protein n=1 Tax=Ptychodera flava TaxID=63121 RepID=UPI00396A35EE